MVASQTNEGGRGPGAPPTVMEPLCAVFRKRLKGIGQKYTPERAQVLDAIIGFDELFDADQVRDRLSRAGRRVSKATVYRTIKLLQDAGIIQRALLDKEQAFYQLAYGRRPRDLLIRVDTNEVMTIDAPEIIALRDRLCAERGLIAQGHRLLVYAVGSAVTKA